jgi:hypothetical protein
MEPTCTRRERSSNARCSDERSRPPLPKSHRQWTGRKTDSAARSGREPNRTVRTCLAFLNDRHRNWGHPFGMATSGDVDVVLVYAPAAEQRYVPRILNTVWIEPDDVVRRAHRGAPLRRLVACTIQAMCRCDMSDPGVNRDAVPAG